jgi:hypothetical protein
MRTVAVSGSVSLDKRRFINLKLPESNPGFHLYHSQRPRLESGYAVLRINKNTIRKEKGHKRGYKHNRDSHLVVVDSATAFTSAGWLVVC